MKKRISIFFLLLLCPVLGLCLPKKPAVKLQKYNTVFMDTFDTVISLTGFAETEEIFQEQAQAVHAAYQQMHKLFDTYHSYEDEGILSIYSLNERAATMPVKVDPILFSLLKFSKSQYALGQGQTNVAMGSVLSIWHDYREAGLADPPSASLPRMEDLKQAAKHTSIEDLILDEDSMSVFFADPMMQLDVGAVAKGYATEIVARMLLSGPMPSFIISAGGNVRLGNPPADGRAAWGVGVQDPDGAILGNNGIAETMYLHDTSVVTSGDYQRFYMVDGVSYHHLIDPDTLMPGAYCRSVTIITEDSGMADFLSTSAYLMPYEASRAFIDSLPEVEAIWLFDDGRSEMTDGIRPYVKSQGAQNPAKS